jgi:predicted nucleic acid-binding protein
MRFPAFWDSSALVALLIYQPATPSVISLYEAYEVVVWWGTPLEIASAIARLVRMKQISSSDEKKAHHLAQKLSDSWSVIQPSDALRTTATELLRRHDLRAADALQLAAALQWCEDTPQGRTFLTADLKLRTAARAAGFDTPEL